MKTKIKFVNGTFESLRKELEEANKRFANATVRIVPITYEEAILINPDVEPRFGEALIKEDEFDKTHEIFVIAKDLEKDSYIYGSFFQMSVNLHIEEPLTNYLFEPNKEEIENQTYGRNYLGLNICFYYKDFKNYREMWKALSLIHNEYVDLTVIVLIDDEDIKLFEKAVDMAIPENTSVEVETE